MNKILGKLGLVWLSISCSQTALAQNAVTETAEEIEQQMKLIEAKTGLVTAKLEKLKLITDQLPKFENKTELKSDGGKFEASLLTAAAVQQAALAVSKDVQESLTDTDSVIVLAHDAKLPINIGVMVNFQIENYKNQLLLADATYQQLCRPGAPASAGVAAAITIFNALTGLLGSETTITGLSDLVDEKMLINTVAARLGNNTQILSYGLGKADVLNSNLLVDLNKVAGLRDSLVINVTRCAAAAPEEKKATILSLLTVAEKFNNFFAELAKPSDSGNSRIVDALLIEKVSGPNSKLLFIQLHNSGGSLIHSKNLWTTFGVDPLKVSGGLIATYSLVNMSDGALVTGGLVVCQTSLSSIRRVHRGKWRSKKGVGQAHCENSTSLAQTDQ